MRLIKAELSKLTHRTAIRVVALGLVAVFAFFSYAIYANTKPPTAEEAQLQEQAYQNDLRDFQEHQDEQVAQCEQNNELAAQTEGAVLDDCSPAALAPQRNWYVQESGAFSEFLDTTTGSMLPLMGGLVTVVIGLLATGSEFSGRTIANWMTVEPRRSRVFGSKLAAVGITSVVIGVIGLGLAYVAPWVAYQLNGLDTSIASSFWGDSYFETAGLTLALITAGGIGGAALGFALRSVVMPLALIMVYGVGAEVLLAQSMPAIGQFLLSNNITAFVRGDNTFSTVQCSTSITDGYNCVEVVDHISRAWATGEFAIILVALIAAGWAMFHYRDID